MKRILALLMAMIIILSLGAVAFADTCTVNAWVGQAGGGSATVNGAVSVEVDSGNTVTLTATPEPGWQFKMWDGDTVADSSSATTTATITNAEANFYAQFELIPTPKVTAEVAIGQAGGGSATVNGALSVEVDSGSTVNLVATPAAGYKFEMWDGATVADPNSATTTATVTENTVYYARFLPDNSSNGGGNNGGTNGGNNGGTTGTLYWVITSVQGSIGGNVSSPAQYEEDAPYTVTAIPQSGYVFDKWIIDGSEKTSNPYTGTMGTDTVMAVAVFKVAPRTQFEVNYRRGEYGQGDPLTDIKTSGAPLTLRGQLFTRKNYTQTGWNTAPDGVSGTDYDLFETYYADSDIKLYPSWRKNTDTYYIRVEYIGNPDAYGYITDSAGNKIGDGTGFYMSAGESRSFTVHTEPGYYAYRVWTEGATSSRSHGAVYNGGSFSVVNPSENKILYVRFENARYYPPTGDDSSLGIFAALALSSIFCLAATVMVKKHEH